MLAEKDFKSARKQSFAFIIAASVLTVFAIVFLIAATVVLQDLNSPPVTIVDSGHNSTGPRPTPSTNFSDTSLFVPPNGNETVILISIDGFRALYWNQFAHEHLSKLANTGVRARIMRPVFPSKTFPNHWSIITGLYPENHGIVGNNFFAPLLNKTFTIRTGNDDVRWWGGEPLWNTCEKQKVKTGSVFWPGSEVDVQNIHRPLVSKYDSKTPYETRVQTVLNYVDAGARFVTLYFEGIDSVGHSHGVSSTTSTIELKNQFRLVDNAIGLLTTELAKRNIDPHIVVVSDHGMTDIDTETRIIDVDQILINVTRAYHMVEPSAGDFAPIVSLFPFVASGESEILIATNMVAQLQNVHPHITFYTKWSLPVRYRYVNNSRIAPVLGLCDENWVATKYSSKPVTWVPKGTHGYDNMLKSMGAMFIANGRLFRPSVIDDVENLDVYNVLAHVLDVTPAPNDGTLLISQLALRTRVQLRSDAFEHGTALPLAHQCSGNIGNATTAPPLAFDLSAVSFADVARTFRYVTLRVTAQTYGDVADEVFSATVWQLQRIFELSALRRDHAEWRGTITARDILITGEQAEDDATTVVTPFCASPRQHPLRSKIWTQYVLWVCLRRTNQFSSFLGVGQCQSNEYLMVAAPLEGFFEL